MAVAYRASIAAATANPTTTFTVVVPSVTQVNDVLFLHVVSRDHTAATALPTVTDNDTGGNTWQQVTGASSTDRKHTIWWKRATSATASKTVTVAGCVGSAAGGVVAYSGAIQTGNPFTNVSLETNASGDQTHASITGEAGTLAPVPFFICNYANDNAVSGLSGVSQSSSSVNFSKLSTGGSDCASACYDIIPNQTTGLTGNITWTQTAGTTYSTGFKIVPKPDFAASQTAARFEEDGTESASAAIDSGASSITRTVTNDSNLLVRFRLQETGGGTSGDSTDDYDLRVALNNSGTYENPAALIAEFPFSNADSSLSINQGQPKIGEAFRAAASFTAQSLLLRLTRTGALSGNFTVKLFAITGTLGTDAAPTGAPLATSAAVAASSIGTSGTDISFKFLGANQIQLQNNSDYCFIVEYSGGDLSGSNYVVVSADVSSPSYDGNFIYSTDGTTFSPFTGYDLTFQLFGNKYISGFDSVNLTEAAATTNRLGSGTGSFVAGKVSKDREVNDLALTVSNYTELVYSIKLLSEQLNNNDTLDFRVYRNGIPLDSYSVTPRITVSKGGPVVVYRRLGLLGVG